MKRPDVASTLCLGLTITLRYGALSALIGRYLWLLSPIMGGTYTCAGSYKAF